MRIKFNSSLIHSFIHPFIRLFLPATSRSTCNHSWIRYNLFSFAHISHHYEERLLRALMNCTCTPYAHAVRALLIIKRILILIINSLLLISGGDDVRRLWLLNDIFKMVRYALYCTVLCCSIWYIVSYCIV